MTREQAQSNIDGPLVAKMIIEFHREFRGVYGTHIHASTLCSVGPLQSMIGLAIANGWLYLPAERDAAQMANVGHAAAAIEQEAKLTALDSAAGTIFMLATALRDIRQLTEDGDIDRIASAALEVACKGG